MGLNLVVIGAGSSYTPELFANLRDRIAPVDVARVVLMDPQAERLDFIAGVCRRLVDQAGLGIEVAAATRLQDALPGADFVIAQIRVGGLAARVRDEKLPMEFGMVGNETTGAGGFVCALRTIPAVMQVAREMEQLAPRAWLLNLSNPAGIVTEALLKHTSIRTLGFCNIPINTTYELAEILGVPPQKVRLDSFGLNHLSWVRRAFVDGTDRLRPLVEDTRDRDSVLYKYGLVEKWLDPDMFRAMAMIPSWYSRYFYFTEQVLEEDKAEAHTKGESDLRAEEDLTRIYSTTGYDERARAILAGKGGSQYYFPVLQSIDSIVHDRGDVVVVDVRNGDAMPDLPPDACVEVPARICRDSAQPLPVGAMPLSVRGLVQTVKAYEQLTIEAARTGDRMIALEALMANPLVGSYSRARPYFERVLENERAYLPQFYH